MPAAGHRPDEHPGIDAVLGHPHPDPPSGAPPLNGLDGVDGQHGDPPSLLPLPRDQRGSRMDGPTRVARSARLRGGDQRGGLCGGSAGG